MISLDEALAANAARCAPLPEEEVPLADASGLALAAEVRAARDQPATDISMMDGYALRSADAPGPLAVVGELAAGDAPWSRLLAPGEAARIFTGAPVPPGAEPGPGKVIGRNPLALAARCRAAGAEATVLGIERDDTEAIAARLAASDADVLVTTGGASVGDHDHAQAALERLGGSLVFHTVAIRPGKPVLFGTASRGRLVFGLPGNPAAAMLGFELFVRLALRILSGDPQPRRPRARAELRGGGLSRVPELTFFPRGRASIDSGRLVFTPGGQQSSMQLGPWPAGNAIRQSEPGEGELNPGDAVEVLLLGAPG